MSEVVPAICVIFSSHIDLQMIRDVAEGKRYRDLKEETNRGQCVAGKGSETEAVDDRWRVCVKGTLRTIVAQGYQDVDI